MRKRGVKLVALAVALLRAELQMEQQLVRQQAQKQAKALAPLLQEAQARAVKERQPLAQAPQGLRTGVRRSPERIRISSKRSRESRTRKPWSSPISR